MKEQPSLAQPEDYHSFLLFHVGPNEASRSRPHNIKKDFKSHGKMLKGSGTQVVFSVLPAGDWDPRRRRQTDQVKWLCG